MPENSANLAQTIRSIAEEGLRASRFLATLETARKNKFLEGLAKSLEAKVDFLKLANAKDLKAAADHQLSAAMIDRLRLDDARIFKMAEGLRQVASLPDPVGEEIERLSPPNGLDIRKVRVPIGVVGIIYESRPNVTVDCAALCLKSGNASILRGGREAFHSNSALAEIISDALREEGLPAGSVQLIPTTDRAALDTLLRLNECIHCIIPRGGEGLIRFVSENATIPVIKHFDGICNLYIESSCDPSMATDLTVNAKCQRPGVCNAIENLVVDAELLESWLSEAATALQKAGVEIRADAPAAAALAAVGIETSPATETDFATEYLDLVLSIKTVNDLQEAVAFINRYGSGHSDGIVTSDPSQAELFLAGVDSATVYWNASTRFTDGFEFSFGAEIGISTDRLHARGPMGLRELCTYKYKIYGHGEKRS